MLTDRLRPLVLDTSGEDLARLLYGPRWREAMRHRPDGVGWEARRGLLPGDLAKVLAPVLRGVLAHDGRSTHENRSGGWWLLRPPTGWEPWAPASVATLLHDAVDDVLTEVLTREEEARGDAEYAAILARRERDVVNRETDPERVRQHETQERDALARAREENFRAGLLNGLRVTAATSGRAFEVALWGLRGRDDFTLNQTSRNAIALDWLESKLDFGEVSPDASNRIAVADVRAAYDAHEGPVLPLRSLYNALDALLGPRLRRVAWSLDQLAVLDEPLDSLPPEPEPDAHAA